MIVACIQVRLSSRRLPKKAIIDLKKKPIFLHVVERLQCAKKINKIVVCTSQNKEDLPIIDICKKNNIEYFAGSENNVIKRFIDAVDKYNPNHIVRSTGENPCVSYEFIDLAIEKHVENKSDYTTTDELPRGMRAEVINFNFLKNLHKNLINPNAEYVTWFVDRPEKWKVNKISVCEQLKRSSYRVTIDTINDLQVVKKIYDALYKDKPICSFEIVKFLDNHQEIVSLNKNYKHRLYEDFKEIVEIRTFDEIINKK